MNTVSHIEQLPEQLPVTQKQEAQPSNLVFYGALILLTHLALLFTNRLLVDNDLRPHIPAELSGEADIFFYASITFNVLFELIIFFVGWLFIVAGVTLLDGKSNARLLFGWMAASFLPMAVFSAFCFVMFLLSGSGADYSGIAEAQTPEQLTAALQHTFSTGVYRVKKIGNLICYLLIIASVFAGIRRLCQLSRLKTAIILGSYVGLLFLLNYFAGVQAQQ